MTWYTKHMVQRLSLKPVSRVELTGLPTSCRVFFQDGTVREKRLDTKLRMFFAVLQNLRAERVSSPRSSCILEPLDLFELLGYSAGEKVAFRGRKYEKNFDMVIEFS